MNDENNPQAIPGAADVVVIGGGIVGSSTALYLARAGHRVVLCEKGTVAGEQSSRNWGFIRKQGRHPLELPLMIHSETLWHQIAEQTRDPIGFFSGGTLYLSETPQRYQSNLDWFEIARQHELDTRLIEPDELQKLAPGIQNQNHAALITPSDCRAEPQLATRAVGQLAREEGAMVHENCAVRGIDIEAGRISGVITEHGRIATSSVVCAAGVWSSYFCRHIGVHFPQLKVTASVMATQPAPLVTESSIWNNGLGMRRRLDGGYTVAYGGRTRADLTPDFVRYFRHFLPIYRESKESVYLRLGKRFFQELGWRNNWDMDSITPFEKERTLNPAADEKLLAQAYRRMEETFPALSGIPIARRWAGMIDATPDELPIISTVDRVPGLVISTGYSGHGFGIGPGAGHVTAQLATGQTTTVNLDGFSIERHLLK